MTSHFSTRETPDLPHRTPSRVEPFPPAIPTMCPHQLHERWFVAEPDQQSAGDVAGGKTFGPRGRATERGATWLLIDKPNARRSFDGCVCMDAYKGGCVVEVPVPDSAESSRGPNLSGSQRQRALSVPWMTAAPRHPYFRIG